jgi:Ca2+-binding RTX toxin-like protein
MCNPAQELQNAFNTVTGWVDQALSGLGKTLDAIAENPLPTIATIALTAVGVPPVVTSLVRTAMTGGSMEDMVINMAVAYVGSEIGAAAGDAAVPELGDISGYGGAGDLAFQPTATDVILKSVISNASAQGATAILQGKNLDEVFNSALTGAVGGLINTSLRTEFGLDPSKFGDRLISDATKAAVSSIFTGKDPGAAIGEALSKSAFGSLANAAATGLKSTFADLQKSVTEYNDIYSKADKLQTTIDDEYTVLSGYEDNLQNLVGEYEDLRGELLNSQESIQLIKQAFADASSGNWRSWVQNDSAFHKAIEKSGYVKYGGFDSNLYARPEDLELKAVSFNNAQFIPGEIIEFSPGNYGEYLGNNGFRHLGREEIARRSTLKPGAEGVTIMPPLPKSVGVSDEGQSLIAFAQKQAGFINDNISQLDATVSDSLANKTQSLLNDFDAAKARYEDNVDALEELQSVLYGPEYTKWFYDKQAYQKEYLKGIAEQYKAAGNSDEVIAQILGEKGNHTARGQHIRHANYFFEQANPLPTNGGLNGRIDELLVARDGYLEDLDESVTSLKEAAGEEISGIAKGIADEAVSLLDANDRSSDEVATAFAGLGYTPSAAEIARFVGEGDDATLSELLGVHVDQNTVDMEEARAAFQGTGYTPTDEELKSFIGQRSETGLDKDAAAFADPRVFDINEVTALAQAEGIKLSARDILNLQKRRLIGVGDEVTLRNQLAVEFDNQFVTKNEARQYFQDLGYEVSEDDLNQFTGKKDESAAFTNIQEYVAGQRELDAQDAGFPDYATQQKFEGNYDTYLESLLPPVVKTVDGGTGNDTLTGAVGDDTFVGGEGADTLVGAAGNDTTQGVEGDEATGGTNAGNIVITGEDGSTVTLGPDGSVVDVKDAEGADPSNVQDVLDRVISNPVNIDTLEGAPGNDTFVGGEGNDTFVIGGDDTLVGGEGNDTFVGDGQDTVDGGAENDPLEGELDEDILDKLFGDDTFIGGDGNDTLDGGKGEDTTGGGDGLGDGDGLGEDKDITDIDFDEGGGGEDKDIIECEEGYVYDPISQTCVPEVVEPPEPVECEEGYVYDPVQGICVPEVISPPEVIECEEGYVYDPVQKMCVPDVPEVIECEEGYVYDPVQGICVPETIVTPPVVTPPVVTPPRPPPPQQCPTGYVYDAKLKQCVPIKPDLPLGLTFDQFAKLFGSPTTQPAAQKPDMSPKFETFYANIPGYKPFDLRQFSSDFFDEE